VWLGDGSTKEVGVSVRDWEGIAISQLPFPLEDPSHVMRECRQCGCARQPGKI